MYYKLIVTTNLKLLQCPYCGSLHPFLTVKYNPHISLIYHIIIINNYYIINKTYILINKTNTICLRSNSFYKISK